MRLTLSLVNRLCDGLTSIGRLKERCGPKEKINRIQVVRVYGYLIVADLLCRNGLVIIDKRRAQLGPQQPTVAGAVFLCLYGQKSPDAQ